MDREYWNTFYSQTHKDIQGPSSFAVHIQDALKAGQTLFELGCGNGRDSVYFASRGVAVTACDQSEVSISELQKRGEGAPFAWPTFICASFDGIDGAYDSSFDAVYSRFTLHAVTKEVGTQALMWASKGLRQGGHLFIEARSIAGSLYGQGEARERDAFIHDGHYRRFIRRDELEAEVVALGFEIVSSVESDGLSVYKTDDPVLIRIKARKT